MLKLTNNQFYKENETMHSVLSDFVHDLPEVPLLDVTPAMTLEIDLDDCYLDDKGDFFVPNSYEWVVSTFDSKDNEYVAHYNEDPILTKLEIANMVAQVEELDLNNPANHAN